MSGTQAEGRARRIDHQLEELTAELAERFHGVFSEQTVYRFVLETYGMFRQQATVDIHLVSLTAHFARQRLTDYGRAQGLTHITAPQVLFVCVHNIGRSQMAGALLEYHAFGRVMIRSAGSQPAGSIPATVVQALEECGISLTKAYPKPLTDEVVRAADVVVTMGCGDSCPVLPGRRYLDWDVEDPVDRPIEDVRRIRDDLERRVLGLLSELWDDQ
ncbi:low molecular weight phosphatase family protein [Saccharopolyspora hattusasensis]|uniref:arsenate-mycothiol transferase ArsC n=1 Tax=Saccharopolyspora hattusasensis TaxID=1128679 RepID=UPI003D988485